MPIDTSIYSQLQPAKVESPLNALAQVMQVQHAQSQNKLADLLFSEKQREISDTSALNDAYRTAVGADGKIDRTKLYTGIAAGGMGSKLPAVQKSFADADEATYKAQAGQIKVAVDKLNAVGQVLGGVKDQASYDAARQWAVNNLGPDAVKNMPAVYDPQLIDAKRREALTVQQQLEQQWKTLDYKLNVDKFDETKRHNRTSEGISAGTLAVSQQRLAFDKSQPKGQYDAERGLLIDPRTGVARPVLAADGSPLGSKGKTPTEFQGKSATFGARAEQADKILSDLEGKYSPAAINSKTSVESVPLVGGMLGAATNAMALSASDQRAEQAQRDFVNAVLRQESGAAISASEFENATKQYFPQPGDGKEVIAQKAKNRKLAVQGFKHNAGPAAFSAAPDVQLPSGWSVKEH